MMAIKRSISLTLSTLILFATPALAQTQNQPQPEHPEYLELDGNIGVLHDLYPNHWAYNAVKYLVHELKIMPPRTPDQFRGDDNLTRYEVAEIFYRAIKKIERAGGKDLKRLSQTKTNALVDVDQKNLAIVNSIVNDYGIMKTFNGNTFRGRTVNDYGTMKNKGGSLFHGNATVTRYEIAFELYNYFNLIEKKHPNTCPIYNRNRAYQLRDLDSRHWAYRAVKNIVDRYQIMDGHTDFKFRGRDVLTRYQAAAVIRNFVEYIDFCLVPMNKKTKPTPPKAKKPLSRVDIRLGGSLRMSSSTKSVGQQGMLYGPEAEAKLWWPKLGWTRFGLEGDGSWLLYDQSHFNINNRLKAGGNINWRLLGNDSDEDVSLYLGAGYEYFQMNFSGANQSSHGPRAKVGFEVPVFSWFSLFAEDTFSYYFFTSPTGIQWKNELFTGVTIPAYTNFSVQLGFADSRYNSVQGTSFGDSGGKVNLRVRW